MADASDAPRTKLDFLYREVLGEAARLVDRLESVGRELGEVARTHAPEGAAESLERAASASTARVRAEFERLVEDACQKLGAVGREAMVARREIRKGRRRDYALWGAIYFGASMLGGAVVALVLRAP